MSADEWPAEAPEYHSVPMTPSSPKPIHVPAPSNIPILEFSENQMDQAYSKATQPVPTADSTAPDNTQTKQVSDTQEASHEQLAGDTATMNDGAATSNGNSDITVVPKPAEVPSDAPDDRLSAPAETQAQAQIPEPQSASTVQSQAPYDVGGVDIQAILDNLAASVAVPQESSGASLAVDPSRAEGASVADPLTYTPNVSATPSSLATTLPPRPPAQDDAPAQALPQSEQSILNSDPTNTGPPGASYQAPSFAPPSLTLAAAPGTDQATGSLPPPPLATFQQDSATPTAQAAVSTTSRSDDGRNTDENTPWGPEVQKMYDEFLQDERRYVLEGKWDNFPVGSRLFIGNLPTERVTKRDLFHVFHKHGKLAQISIKQAYGFIQFLEREACQQAHQIEQNVSIRGKKVNLEISKPQRNSKGAGGGSGRNERGGQQRRRSRSPPHNAKTDRYVGTGARGRDRSPNSPPRRRRSPDRRRSRSRSPRRANRASDDDDASLPLPHRAPHAVPEVQIIAKHDPDRAYVQYVDAAFKSRGVRSDVLLLSPNLSEPAVVRRQIIEGVLAVMKLDRNTMTSQKYGLSIFDRSAGNANVRFEEYADLDLPIAVELVLRARQTARPPQPPAAPLSQYGLPIVAPVPGAPPHPFSPGLGSMPAFGNMPGANAHTPASGAAQSNVLAGMDANALQALLGSLGRSGQQPSASQPPVHGQGPSAAPNQDILALLGQLGSSQSQSQSRHASSNMGYSAPAQPQSPSSQQGLPPALAALLAGTNGAAQGQAQGQAQARGGGAQQGQGQGQSQGQPDMSAIMAQLAKYNGR